jgi:hypothetical protein
MVASVSAAANTSISSPGDNRRFSPMDPRLPIKLDKRELGNTEVSILHHTFLEFLCRTWLPDEFPRSIVLLR